MPSVYAFVMVTNSCLVSCSLREVLEYNTTTRSLIKPGGEVLEYIRVICSGLVLVLVGLVLDLISNINRCIRLL